MRECLSPQVEAEGLDIVGSDMSRRRARSEQGRKVSVAHVFLRVDVCEELGEAGLCIQQRRE